MAGPTLLIVYYSRRGHTERMAASIADGAAATGAAPVLCRAEECSLEDMAAARGIAVGSPTYFSNMAWPVKKLIDESILLYTRGRLLRNRPCGAFTSSGTSADARDCLDMLEKAFGFHHQMRLIPGIMAIDREPEDLVRRRCLAFGRQLAEAIIRTGR